jgi:hypothetical protein
LISLSAEVLLNGFFYRGRLKTGIANSFTLKSPSNRSVKKIPNNANLAALSAVAFHRKPQHYYYTTTAATNETGVFDARYAGATYPWDEAEKKAERRMIYAFRLPTINPLMSDARIECVFAEPGDPLKAGSKLLDLGIDLSSAFAQECPPISFYRVVLRERAFLRKFDAARGQLCQPGALIALFSTEPDEDLNTSPSRDIRFTVAGILHHNGLWTGSKAWV